MQYADVRSSSTDLTVHSTLDPDDLGMVGWSTGTTGVPKGLAWTHEGLVFTCQVNAAKGNIRSDGVFPNKLTPGFQAWIYLTLPVFYAGAKLVFLREFDPQQYLEAIENEGITSLVGVPTQLKRLVQEDLDAYDLSTVTNGWYGGETIDDETLATIRAEITPTFYPTFATSEASGTSGLFEDVYKKKPKSIGRGPPLVDLRAIELRRDGAPPPDAVIDPGERGELIIRTPARAEYVLDDEEKTNEIFRDGWWYSGDVVYKDEDGDLFITGRKDFMIISGGINVSPSTIESVLREHPAVGDVVVCGVPDEEWGQRVTAFVDPDREFSATELDEHCLESEELPRHTRPREYVAVDRYPKTPSGKVDRQELVDSIERDSHED
jgi:fatty-acyl-CoA synthase